MDIKTTAKVLTSLSKPYQFADGKSGVSHKVRLFIGDSIFEAKASADLVKDLTPYVGQEVEVALRLTSPKEVLSLALVSFGA